MQGQIRIPITVRWGKAIKHNKQSGSSLPRFLPNIRKYRTVNNAPPTFLHCRIDPSRKRKEIGKDGCLYCAPFAAFAVSTP